MIKPSLQSLRLLLSAELLDTSVSLEEFQEFTRHMQAEFFKPMPTSYYALAVAGEAGELANEVKKLWRQEPSTPSSQQLEKIASEAADILVYLLCLSSSLDFDLGSAFKRAYRDKIFPRLREDYYAHEKIAHRGENDDVS